MQNLIDNHVIGKKITDTMFGDAERLATKFGIDPNKGIAHMANKFSKIFDGNTKGIVGTKVPGSVASEKTLYHSGADLTGKEINLSKSNFQKTFYMSENPQYAKAYGGKNASLNKITVDPNANLFDLRKPSETQVKTLENAFNAKIAKNVPYSDNNFSFYPYSKADVIQGIKEGKAHFAELPQVKQVLRELGYDGQITQEANHGANYGVWNKKVISVKK